MFRVKIALFATLISGSVLIVFGLFFLYVINAVSLNRIDREILALGESQLHVWHPKEHWQNFGDSIRFIYGKDRWLDLIVQIKDSSNRTLYQSPHWPDEISAADFSGFDFEMEAPLPPDQPLEPPLMDTSSDNTNKGDHFTKEERRPWPAPPFAPFDHRPPPPRLGDPNGRPAPLPMRIKKPFFSTLETKTVTWRLGIMGNQHLTIRIGIDMAGFYMDADRFQKAFLFTVPIALVLLAAGGWLIAHRAMKPVELITRTAEGITVRGLDQRIPSTGADAELHRLVNVINDMLDRLEKSFDQAVRFSADAAHELQTPLTILQGILDDGVQHAPNDSDEQRRYSDLLEEVRRLKVIIQKLLILARADAGQLVLQLEPINLSVMIESIVEDTEAIAPHLQIEHQISSEVMVRADKELLRQVLHNLAANAVKYNIDNGRIRFQLDIQNNIASFRISNTGPLIPLEDRERIFDRFYRMDKSRSNKVPGTGLGLSLAKEITRAHNGKLTFDISSEEVSALPTHRHVITFVLSLPCTA